MKQYAPQNNRHTITAPCVLAYHLMVKAPLSAAPHPHQEDAIQVSMRLPGLMLLKINSTGPSGDLNDTGNSHHGIFLGTGYFLERKIGIHD